MFPDKLPSSLFFPFHYIKNILQDYQIEAKSNFRSLEIKALSQEVKRLLKLKKISAKNISISKKHLIFPNSSQIHLDHQNNNIIINNRKIKIQYEYLIHPYVSTVNLMPFSRIHKGDLKKQGHWIRSSSNINFLKELNQPLEYFILAKHLKKGKILERHHLKKRPLVSFGKSVQVILKKKNLFIQSLGTIQGQGGINDSVPIKLPSGKRINGIVKSEEIVHALL